MAGEFGESVAIYQNEVIVGASEFTFAGGGNPGAAYPFFRTGTTWTAGARIDDPDPKGAGHFGFAVDVYGSHAVIGSYNKSFDPDGNGTGLEGAAYAFANIGPGTWDEPAELRPFDTAELDHFGWSVAIDQGRIVIGAPGKLLSTLPDVGAIYGFIQVEGDWTETGSFQPEEAEANQLGRSVATGTWVVGGAPFDDEVIGGAFKVDVGSCWVKPFWE
jgi:hypothetical protein